MAKVLLAKARFTTTDQQSFTPPMGLLYLASALRSAGHEPILYDAKTDWDSLSNWVEIISRTRPDVIGLSAITFEAKVLESMLILARKTAPGTPIVVGGAHATGYPESCARHPAVNYVVVGEGEDTIVELVDALTRGGAPAEVPGVVSLDQSGKVVFAPPRKAPTDLDSMPLPAWDLLDLDFYARNKSMDTMGLRPYMTLVTSRGCPYRCTYCHRVHGKIFRPRSPDNILKEIEILQNRYGIYDYQIIDDNFNLNSPRMEEILDGIIAMNRVHSKKVVLNFPNGVRTDLLTPVQIQKLAFAGTQYMAIAVETASERLQRAIMKNLDLERVRENIHLAVSAGIFANGFFMLGFPSETLDEARMTVDFAVKSRLYQALFFVVIPYQGTAMYDMCTDILAERGITLDPNDLDYFKGKVNVSEMTDDELYGLQRRAYKRFYINPARVMRILLHHPRPLSLMRYFAAAAVKMLPRVRGNRWGQTLSD